MARIVKKHDVRLNEIIDAAQMLFYTKGFDVASVNEIINTIGIAKGTFYHYFSSKYDLLNAVIERFITQISESIQPIMQDENMNAVEKLNTCFRQIGQIKFEKKEFMFDLLKIMNRDENIVLRYKMITRSIEFLTPIISQIIQQGMSEGLFNTEYPLESAEYILSISGYLNAKVSRVIFEIIGKKQDIKVLMDIYTAYQRTIERIIGAAEKSVCLVDPALIEKFFNSEEE
ncbi:TetR/AcrR family transcriptional regulator [bacterium]|nr:MAG: TetR/AcrR family transcriptional regulator [bacterium]